MSSSPSGPPPSKSSDDTNQEQLSSESPKTSSSGSSWSSWIVSPSTLKDRFQVWDDQQRIDRLSECRKLDNILHDCRKRHQPGRPKSRYTSPNDNDDDPIESISIGVRNMKYFGWRGILYSSSPSPSQQKDPSANGEIGGDTNTEANSSSSSSNNNKMAANRGPDLSVFHPGIRSSCAREEHAVWACRAISTGCGRDLSELKKCFDDVDSHEKNLNNEASSLPQHVRVLTSPYTNYQGIVEKVGGELSKKKQHNSNGIDNNNNNNNNSDDDGVSAMKRQIPCHEIQLRLGSCVTENGKQLLERKQQRERKQQQQQ